MRLFEIIIDFWILILKTVLTPKVFYHTFEKFQFIITKKVNFNIFCLYYYKMKHVEKISLYLKLNIYIYILLVFLAFYKKFVVD